MKISHFALTGILALSAHALAANGGGNSQTVSAQMDCTQASATTDMPALWLAAGQVQPPPSTSEFATGASYTLAFGGTCISDINCLSPQRCITHICR